MRRLKANYMGQGKTPPYSVALLLIVLGFLALQPGCGKKGPPVAPHAVTPPPVKDLKAEMEMAEGRLQLSWSMPDTDRTTLTGIEGFTVFRYRTKDSGDLCTGCPIPFESFLSIRPASPEPAIVEGNRVICYDAIENGYWYAYKVVVFHKSGGRSEDSNLVFYPEPVLRSDE